MDASLGLEKLALAEKGQAAAIALPLIEAEVSRMRSSVFSRVFLKIRDNNLTPEEAYNAWLEIYAYHRLLKNFTQTVSIGLTAAEASPANMNP